MTSWFSRCPLLGLLHLWLASKTCTKRRPRGQRVAKSANLWCRLEGVVLFWHFLRRTDDRAAYKRVKTFFARGNRVRRRSGLRWWGGRRRWLLLPEQSNGSCHQCNKHKTESFVHKTPFGGSCHLAGRKGPSFRTPAIYYTHEVPNRFASDSYVRTSPVPGLQVSGYGLPAQPIDATPSNRLTRQYFLLDNRSVGLHSIRT